MTQPTEHRAVTAEQACVEFESACREVEELQSLIGYLDHKIRAALMATDCAVTADRAEPEVRRASDRFWLLLEMRAFAARHLQDVLAGRQYAYDVWMSTTSREAVIDTNVSTPVDMRVR